MTFTDGKMTSPHWNYVGDEIEQCVDVVGVETNEFQYGSDVIIFTVAAVVCSVSDL